MRKLRKYDDALLLVQRYSSGKIADEFPPHKTEILNTLQGYLTAINRPQQKERIIKAIKKHFGIQAINQTSREAIVKANKKIIPHLLEYGFVFDHDTNTYTLEKGK